MDFHFLKWRAEGWVLSLGDYTQPGGRALTTRPKESPPSTVGAVENVEQEEEHRAEVGSPESNG